MTFSDSDKDEDEWKAILIPMDPETERMAADFVPFYSDDRASILDEVRHASLLSQSTVI